MPLTQRIVMSARFLMPYIMSLFVSILWMIVKNEILTKKEKVQNSFHDLAIFFHFFSALRQERWKIDFDSTYFMNFLSFLTTKTLESWEKFGVSAQYLNCQVSSLKSKYLSSSSTKVKFYLFFLIISTSLNFFLLKIALKNQQIILIYGLILRKFKPTNKQKLWWFFNNFVDNFDLNLDCNWYILDWCINH